MRAKVARPSPLVEASLDSPEETVYTGDQAAQSSYRITPTCCTMWQAVGTAAGLAVKGDVSDVRHINIAALRSELTACGMELDPR
ncbi:MAG: hypothetical protein AMJ93_10155 [Anaerolineae bacterium SM23_84]|nr:MAG: hypothetical protein AMJ93_10155 [Anaerolineae bacterium SM23_84]